MWQLEKFELRGKAIKRKRKWKGKEKKNKTVSKLMTALSFNTLGKEYIITCRSLSKGYEFRICTY